MKAPKQSEQEYDLLHQESGFGEEQEYYQLLGTFLKGTKSVDIGCGYGMIERYSPQTVAVDFSEEALKMARKNGAKKTVKASAEKLPFKNNEFEVSLSLGVLEHVVNQEKAIREMVRVSQIQIIIAHARLPCGLELVRKPILKLFGHHDQPIEEPLTAKQIEKMLLKNGSRVLVRGVWNYIDLRWLWRKIPYGVVKFPSHHFLLAIKTANLERKFLGEKENFKEKQAHYFDHQAEEITDVKKKDRAGEFELATVLSFLQLPPHCKILEFGCGAGRYTLKLLAAGHDVWGVDISQNSLKKLGQQYRLQKKKNWGQLHLSSVLPKEGQFDVCFCVNILHHLESIGETLTQLRKKLKKGGTLFVFEPNPLYLPWYGLFLIKGILSLEKGILNSNIWNLKKELEKAGFKKITIKPYGLLPTRLLSWSFFLLELTALKLSSLPLLRLFVFHHLIKAEK